MAIIEQPAYRPLDFEDDPDDYRPDSELALVVDPSDGPGPHVEGMSVFCERMAVGDEIPLHRHREDEVFFLVEGAVEARVGEETREIGPGAVVFIPGGMKHGFRNVGEEEVRIQAVFSSREVSIQYFERNPAPGTEGDPPGPPLAFDVRELVEGDPEQAVRPVDPEAFGE